MSSKWSPESKLADSPFTGQFLIQKLEENCDKFRGYLERFDVVDIKSGDISEGSGYMSKVYKCEFVFGPKSHPAAGATSPQPDPQAPVPTFMVMLKVPGTESVEKTFEDMNMDQESEQKAFEVVDKMVSEVHDIEISMYAHLKDTHLPIPRCYGFEPRGKGKKFGFLILEYLDGVFPDLHEGLSLIQARHVVDFVLELQVEGLRQGDWWTDLPVMNFGDDQDDNSFSQMLDGLTQGQDKEFAELVDKYALLLKDNKVCKAIGGQLYLDSGLPKMLMHGDLWTNNLCFKKDPVTGKATDTLLAAIDWQMSGPMNPFWDICRVVVMCCEADVRRELESQILDYYVDGITARTGKDLKDLPFTRKELESALPYAYAANAMIFMFMCCIHYREHDDKTLNKKQKLLKRLECVLTDYLPMMQQHFSEYLQ